MTLSQRIDDFKTGKKIKHWLVQKKLRGRGFQDFTPKVFDVIARATGSEFSNILNVTDNGIGHLLVKFNNEVLFKSYQFKLINLLSFYNLHSLLS